MRLDQLREVSDHLHDDIGVNEDGRLEATTDFDFHAVDRGAFGIEPEEDDVVSFSDMSAVLALIVGWICVSPNIAHCAPSSSIVARAGWWQQAVTINNQAQIFEH